jgi:hypothetical protein
MIFDTSTITKSSEIQEIYALLKTRQQVLDRRHAENFRLNQKVTFISNGSRWHGEVESISKAGKIKIKLTAGGIHGPYTHYTLGAASLHENLY